MRAYRAVERERREALRGDRDLAAMAERMVELTSERDRLWQQVVRLQQRIKQLENALSGDTTESESRAPAAMAGLPRAERRRLEREQRGRRAQ